MPTSPEKTLGGRRAQAARNDEVILEAARAVFLDDPKAPIAAVAERAGVGISALYRRYASKEDLLRRLCHDGLRRYIAEADAALAEPDDWTAFRTFLAGVVDADVHSLTVHLAGTFTPTEEMGRDARRAAELAAALFERARASGRLRPDVVVQDLGLLLEACAAVRVPDSKRTGELRRRQLAVLLAGLSAVPTADPLPGPAPAAGEFDWRWRRRE
ncbi:TetR/AcrR family transcriptional regulator [Micromonospora sp. WMMD964]|uniref:TetR/AcrR family transcriptional regulator n=1 Tax=Micromonospora sp. WMMD964 TaxID=3016091 RepID=UPI00249BD226|nr:TetR/AcrR family transcriptional regulator [Micromonospora sp. WMMD964]WFF02272.1 helix-turn-helix domain containing protein [Micromonospora sp. WMMD964]